MNCTTESKSWLKETGNEAMESEGTRKPLPCFQGHWTSFLNQKEDWKHISGSSAQSVTPIS